MKPIHTELISHLFSYRRGSRGIQLNFPIHRGKRLTDAVGVERVLLARDTARRNAMKHAVRLGTLFVAFTALIGGVASAIDLDLDFPRFCGHPV